MAWIALAFVFIAANFLYQAVKNRAWGIATERSWFQITALILIYVDKPWKGW